ncbi:MAG TPA: PAS-domain containing protein [Magnetospirillaceae bacterium]|jgi:two-component system cell cycle sensor histidine kinase PleC
MSLSMMTSLGEAIAIALIIGALVEVARRSRIAQMPGRYGINSILAGFALLLIGALAAFASDYWTDGRVTSPEWGYVALDIVSFVTLIGGLLLVLRGILAWLPVLRSLSAETHAQAVLAETHKRLTAEAEALLVDALDSTDEGFAVYDADGKLSAVNKGYRVRLPANVHFEIGDHFDTITRSIVAAGTRTMGLDNQLMPPGQAPPLNQFMAGPVEQLLPDGRWLRVAARPTRAGGIVVTTNDITDRKRREHQIAGSVAQMTAIIDNMPVGVALFDSTTGLLACNERLRQWLKLPRELTLPGTPLLRFLTYTAERGDFGDQDSDADIARLTERMSAGSISSELSVPGGQVLEMHGTALSGGTTIVTFSDITERKRIQDAEHRAMVAMAEAARVKSDFLANMSHELRTPLNAIIGFSEVMSAQILGPLSDKYREYAGDITASARHLLALIGDVLDLSKVEAGRMELSDEIVDIAQVAASCVTMVTLAANKGKIIVSTAFPAALPGIRGDRRRILQVLLNLLTNAVKFTREDGRIVIGAQAQSDGLRITIADTGIGIAAEDIPRVMQDWGQARSDLTRDGEGTGLGLPLSRRLMELHDGTLQLESTVGVGTTVSLWFPSARLAPSIPAPAAAGSNPVGASS